MIAVLPPTSPPLSDVPSVDSNSKLGLSFPSQRAWPTNTAPLSPPTEVRRPHKVASQTCPESAPHVVCVVPSRAVCNVLPILSLEAVRDAVSLELPKDLATAATFDFAHLREVVASNAEKISSAVNTNPIPDTVWMPSHSLFYLAGSSGFRANPQ